MFDARDASCDNLHPGEVHLVCYKNRKCIFPEQLNKTVKQNSQNQYTPQAPMALTYQKV